MCCLMCSCTDITINTGACESFFKDSFRESLDGSFDESIKESLEEFFKEPIKGYFEAPKTESGDIGQEQEIEYNYEYNKLKHDKDSWVDGAVNYYLYYRRVNGTVAPAIKIYNSHKYRNEDEQREIIQTIIAMDKGEHGFSLDDIDYYVLEWKFHNFAYDHPKTAAAFLKKSEDFVVNSSRHVDLNTNDFYADFYRCFGALAIESIE